LERLIIAIQKFAAWALTGMLIVVVVLSTGHLGVLIEEEVLKPPRFLIPVDGLLEIFGYFLLVLIGVELLETLKAYIKKDVIHMRVVLEVALIAMARKVIIAEPDHLPSLALFGMASLILALGVAFYIECKVQKQPDHHLQ
jgi:Predicted membrane protein